MLSTRVSVTFNNVTATKALKQLRANKNSKGKDEDKLIKRAFNIYNHINEPVDKYVIDALLRTCLKFNHSDHLFSIWDDIKQINGVSYLLLLQCCVASNNIDKCTHSPSMFNLRGKRM